MTWVKAAGPPTREPTPEEDAAITEMRAVAVEWAAGNGTLTDVLTATRPKQRWLTVRFTPPEHATFRPLMHLLDALIKAEGAYATKHGIVDAPMLMETGAKVGREGDRTKLTFPVAYRGGQSVYQADADRGPRVRPFGVAPQQEQEREWWERPST